MALTPNHHAPELGVVDIFDRLTQQSHKNTIISAPVKPSPLPVVVRHLPGSLPVRWSFGERGGLAIGTLRHPGGGELTRR
jgi:hypothetical protein